MIEDESFVSHHSLGLLSTAMPCFRIAQGLHGFMHLPRTLESFGTLLRQVNQRFRISVQAWRQIIVTQSVKPPKIDSLVLVRTTTARYYKAFWNNRTGSKECICFARTQIFGTISPSVHGLARNTGFVGVFFNVVQSLKNVPRLFHFLGAFFCDIYQHFVDFGFLLECNELVSVPERRPGGVVAAL